MAKHKINRAKPSKKAAAEARLQSLLAERKTLVALITNPVQLVAAARGLLGDLDEAEVLGNLREQIAKIDDEVPKLRKLLGSRAIIPIRPAESTIWPHDPDPWPPPWPPFPWPRPPLPPFFPFFPWPPFQKKKKVTQVEGPRHPTCQGTFGVTPVTDTTDVEISLPSLSQTVYDAGFNTIQEPGYFGLSFADMFIDTTRISNLLSDSFFVMRALAFDFPAVDCKGTFSCDVNYDFALTPEVGANPGQIQVVLHGRLYANPVPNYTGVVFQQFQDWHGGGVSNSGFTTVPDNAYFIQRPRRETVNVAHGDAPALYLAVSVNMSSRGGIASFDQNGNPPVGHFIVLGEGIPYTFTPA